MHLLPYLRLLRLRELSLRWQRCPLCRSPLLLRLSRQEHAVRCVGCRAGPAHMSMGAALRRLHPSLAQIDAYEMSSRGPLVRLLAAECRSLQMSEYIDEVETGTSSNGVRCENVEALTFDSDSFDLCTSTEVFEHVADDEAGFRELWRILRPGGTTVFTVPLNLEGRTVERAERRGDRIHHHLPPEYHDDHLRGSGRVLAFRTYGVDIVERLRTAGFREAHIDRDHTGAFHGFGRGVVIARK